MLSSNLVRLVLFLALVTVASMASAVAAPAAGRAVGTWLVQHGVVGAWGVAAGLFVGFACCILLIEGCSRLAYLGAPGRAGPRSSALLAFFLGGSVLLACGIVLADYLARALTPFVGTPVHPWLEPLLLVLGVVAIGVLGDRLAPRFGISITRRPTVQVNAASSFRPPPCLTAPAMPFGLRSPDRVLRTSLRSPPTPAVRPRNPKPRVLPLSGDTTS